MRYLLTSLLCVLTMSLTAQEVGCTYLQADNYSAIATVDDGTCVFECITCGEGTILNENTLTCVFDAEFCGWQPDGNADGLIGVVDLLDLLAVYGDSDTDDDGVWDSVDYCIDLNACNYQSNPTNQCYYLDVVGVCGGWCTEDADGDGICDWDCGGNLEYDSYNYSTVLIGDQCWLKENLRNTRFANLEQMEFNPSDAVWSELAVGACCAFNYDDSTNSQRGLLYNLHAVIDERGICPAGWHVPTDEEFLLLEASQGLLEDDWWDYGVRGIEEEVGSNLKDSVQWIGNNISGFSAVPSGLRRADGNFYGGNQTLFWTSSTSGNSAISRSLSGVNYNGGNQPPGIGRMSSGYNNFFGLGYYSSSRMGMSVRCIRD